GLLDSGPAMADSKPGHTFPTQDALHASRDSGIVIAHKYHPAFATRRTSAARSSQFHNPVQSRRRTVGDPRAKQAVANPRPDRAYAVRRLLVPTVPKRPLSVISRTRPMYVRPNAPGFPEFQVKARERPVEDRKAAWPRCRD